MHAHGHYRSGPPHPRGRTAGAVRALRGRIWRREVDKGALAALER